MKISYILRALILSFVFFSCEKNEIPILPHNSGEIISRQIELYPNYQNQVFYSIKNDLVVSSNLKTDWDMAFESSEQGYNILLNSSTFSQLTVVDDITFEEVTEVLDSEWNWDNPKGMNYGTAIGDPRINNSIYIINRGYNINGIARGYKKISIDTITNNYYSIRYANLDNTEMHIMKINKDSNFNFQYLSFTLNDTINIEPQKNKWDLLFTQYTHIFDEEIGPSPYLVTGVLTNYINQIEVAVDTNNLFADIEYNMLMNYDFASFQDIIGYDWKYYNFDTQSYSIDSEKNYIIKDQQGYYYKMHFVDFYNDLGDKGYPMFEFQQL